MTLGRIAFLGSGETSLAGGRIFETLARLISDPLRIAILETPAGFELNASLVAGRVGEFLKTRLQNYKPIIDLVPARKKGTEFSPDNPDILKPLLQANMIFMGPGSPSYVARQLKGTLTWDIIRARHRQGATLIFASAATISVGQWVLPVYEIYKVGEDVHVKDGLERLPGHGEPVNELKARGILLDGTTEGGKQRLLLQIFSQTMLGPLFFEFIPRKGDEGFGEGNFKALFESMERDQLRRGIIEAA